MTHNHSHDHAPRLTNVGTAFVVGIVLNFLFVGVEVVMGLWVHSLSLLSDAGHNLADVASLALSLFALRMSRVKPTQQYTYGFKKSTVLAALFNAVVLLVSIGAIGYEALHRFFNPEPVSGSVISVVAGIGIVINTTTALLFLKDKEKDLNVKSAFLHLMSDAVVSVGLVIGGLVIYFTGLTWIDPLLSVVVALVILVSTWNLLRDSLKLSLDGVPAGIDLEKIRTEALKIKGLTDLHHIHIWAMSTTENALTAHLVVSSNTSNSDIEAIKHHLRHALEHLDIQHATLETEFDNTPCSEPDC